MKVIYNSCYGGFSFNKDFAKKMGIDYHDDSDEIRTNPAIIQAILNGEDVSGNCSELCVAVIPNMATDWWIKEYDGAEEIYCVMKGSRWCVTDGICTRIDDLQPEFYPDEDNTDIDYWYNEEWLPEDYED